MEEHGDQSDDLCDHSQPVAFSFGVEEHPDPYLDSETRVSPLESEIDVDFRGDEDASVSGEFEKELVFGPRCKDSLSGSLVLHYPDRTIRISMDEESAFRVSLLVQHSSGPWASSLNPGMPETEYGWMVLNLDRLLGASWSPSEGR